MGSGKRWDKQENIFGCQSFVRASIASTNGVARKKEHFQQSIEDEYKKLVADYTRKSSWVPSATRTGNAVFVQYKRIKQECLRFEQCYEMVQQKNLTGSPSDTDLISISTAVYNDSNSINTPYVFIGENPISPGRPFRYINCYLWLRTQHLWSMIKTARDLSQPIHPGLSQPSGSIDLIDPEDEITSANTVPPLPEQGPSLSNNAVPPLELQAPSTSPSASSTVIVATAASTPTRPPGARKTIEKNQLTQSINRSAKMFESFLEQAKKKDEIMNNLLETMRERNRVERLREERELFDSPSTDAQARAQYIQYRTQEVLSQMNKESIRTSTVLQNTASTPASSETMANSDSNDHEDHD